MDPKKQKFESKKEFQPDITSALLDGVPVLAFFIDQENKIAKVNAAFADFVGKTKSELESLPLSDLLLDEGMKEEPGDNLQIRIATTKGPRWIKLDRSPLSDALGKTYGSICYALNTTEQKQLESIFEPLKDNENKYRLIVELMHEGISAVNKEHSFTYVNKNFASMLGYEKEELLGKSIYSFVDGENAKIFDRQMASRSQGIAQPYEVAWVKKNGQPIVTLMSPSALMDLKGNYFGSFAVSTDITERKKIEEEIKSSKAQLESKVSELERFYKLSIGRENRMSELKQKIRQLEAQLAAPKQPLQK